MNYVNFTSQCGLLNREKGEKTFETSGRVITFETKLYIYKIIKNVYKIRFLFLNLPQMGKVIRAFC